MVARNTPTALHMQPAVVPPEASAPRGHKATHRTYWKSSLAACIGKQRSQASIVDDRTGQGGSHPDYNTTVLALSCTTSTTALDTADAQDVSIVCQRQETGRMSQLVCDGQPAWPNRSERTPKPVTCCSTHDLKPATKGPWEPDLVIRWAALLALERAVCWVSHRKGCDGCCSCTCSYNRSAGCKTPRNTSRLD